MNQQPTIDPNTALANVIAVYKQVRLTPEEHDIMKASLNVLYELVEKDKMQSKTAKKTNSETNQG